jgi:hypothetical protein
MNTAETQLQTLMKLWQDNTNQTLSLIRVYGDPPSKDSEIIKLKNLSDERKKIEKQIDDILIQLAEQMQS